MTTLAKTRAGMLGLGKHPDDMTPEQRRLSLLILCRPFPRDFTEIEPASRRDYLERRQLRLFDLRSEFVLARSVDELAHVRQSLLDIEAELCRAVGDDV